MRCHPDQRTAAGSASRLHLNKGIVVVLYFTSRWLAGVIYDVGPLAKTIYSDLVAALACPHAPRSLITKLRAHPFVACHASPFHSRPGPGVFDIHFYFNNHARRVDVHWALVAEEPRRSTTLNLEHPPLYHRQAPAASSSPFTKERRAAHSP